MRRTLRQRILGLFSSGAVTGLITVVAVVAVAAVTVVIVEVAVPKSSPPSATISVTGDAIGTFSRHPVRISLPDEPGSYLGAYADGVPRSYKPVESFASATSVQPNLALYYSGWDEPFQTSFAMKAVSHGAVPLVQIEPGGNTSLAAIAVGGYDHYLEVFATAVASFGARTGHGVVIGFGHEPNGTWYPWGAGKPGKPGVAPATWIAAWRHIVQVFRQQGADDVAWLWTVNIMDTNSGIRSPVPWWPGKSYVTWIGIDGYFYKPSWTFASLFGPTIAAVRTVSSKPILIAETAAAPAAGKPAKIANLFAGVHDYGLLGFVWFDAKRHRDWRLNSAGAGAAVRQGAATFTKMPS